MLKLSCVDEIEHHLFMIAQKKYSLKIIRLKVQKCLNRFLDPGAPVNVVTQIYK